MKKVILGFSLLLAGCEEPSPGPQTINLGISRPLEGKRFQVEVACEFTDYSHHKHFRNIYIIKDNKTGKEYIGINGVGMAEARDAGSKTTNLQEE